MRRLLLLSVVWVAVWCQPTINAVDAPATMFQTLFSMDCDGVARILPDSLFSMAAKSTTFHRMYNTFLDRIKERVMCKCPSLTEDQFRGRYNLPDVFLNFIQEKPTDDFIQCLDTVGEGLVRDLHKMLKLGLGDTSLELPSTCTWDTFKTTGCMLQMNTPMDAKVQLIAKRCPNSYLPYLGVHCGGPGCKLLTPCDTDSHCGSAELECKEVLGESADMDMFKGLRDAGLYAEADTYENPECPNDTPVSMVKRFFTHFKSYFPGDMSNPNEKKFKVCLPKEAEDPNADSDSESTDMIEAEQKEFEEDWVVTEIKTEPKLLCEVVCDPAGWCYNETVGPTSYKVRPATGKTPLQTWDGMLANGQSAGADTRILGKVYHPINTPPLFPGESHLFGASCNGDFALMGGGFMESIFQASHLHKSIHQIAVELSKAWTCRGQSTDNFRLNWEAYQVDPWMYKYTEHSTAGNLDWGPFNGFFQMVMEEDDERLLTKGMRVAGHMWDKVTGNTQRIKQREMLQAAHKHMHSLHSILKRPHVKKTLEVVAPLVLRAMGVVVPSAAEIILSKPGKLLDRAMRAQADEVKIDQFTMKDKFIMPATCTYDTWKSGGTCNAEYKLNDIIASTDLRMRMSRCGTDHSPASTQFYCTGGACNTNPRHCMGTQTCSGTQECVDLANDKDTKDLYKEDYLAALLWGYDNETKLNGPDRSHYMCQLSHVGIGSAPTSDSCTSTDKWSNDLLQIYAKTFNDGDALQHAGTTLKVCFLRPGEVEDKEERKKDWVSRTMHGNHYDYTVKDLGPLGAAPPPPTMKSVSAVIKMDREVTDAELKMLETALAAATGVSADQIKLVADGKNINLTVRSHSADAVGAQLERMAAAPPKALQALGVQGVEGVKVEEVVDPVTGGAATAFLSWAAVIVGMTAVALW